MNINKLAAPPDRKFNGVPTLCSAQLPPCSPKAVWQRSVNLDYYRPQRQGHRRRTGRVRRVVLRRQEPSSGCAAWQHEELEFFDWLLENCGVVGTPGVGFGECGEGYFRLTAFGDAEKTKLAAQRIKAAIKAL